MWRNRPDYLPPTLSMYTKRANSFLEFALFFMVKLYLFEVFRFKIRTTRQDICDVV